MGDYSFAKTRLQWARERHAEARAAAADFKRLANLENPALCERGSGGIYLEAGVRAYDKGFSYFSGMGCVERC